MRYGIFSDAHGNLESMRAAYDYYKKKRIDRIIYLGDVVGYGANPCEAIELLKSFHPICVAGNHDWAVLDRCNINFFNSFARKAVLWTKKELRSDDFEFLKTFPLSYQGDDFTCVHGSLIEPEKFSYIMDAKDALESFTPLKKRILFIGHSHRRESFSLYKNEIEYSLDSTLKLKEGVRYIINVGSIGQPRDGDPRASVCIYDTELDMFSSERIEYDIEKAAEKIIKNGLPFFLAERLFSGR